MICLVITSPDRFRVIEVEGHNVSYMCDHWSVVRPGQSSRNVHSAVYVICHQPSQPLAVEQFTVGWIRSVVWGFP